VEPIWPAEPIWPLPVLGKLDGDVLGLVVGRDVLHGLVVDQEVAAVVAGEADVFQAPVLRVPEFTVRGFREADRLAWLDGP
jgi:hypothetical protein